MKKRAWKILIVCVSAGVITGSFGCHKFLSAPASPGLLTGDQLWNNDSLTAGVLNGTLSILANGDLFDGGNGLSINFGAYGDELMPVYANPFLSSVYNCSIPVDFISTTNYWDEFYIGIYAVNAVIAGAGASTGLVHRQQWLGEAYFLRAQLYFYLTNIFGDVPLALSTDYSTNNALARSPQKEVFQQIVNDVQKAEEALDDTYHDGKGISTADHGRPNRSAANALLARVELYEGDWQDAETAATTVINDPQYSLGTPIQTFQANSGESIWQLAPGAGRGVDDYPQLLNGIPVSLPTDTSIARYVYYQLADSLVNAFEAGDARSGWLATITAPGTTYHLAAKYSTDTPGVEYIMMCRLAELYLIRAEARAQQGNISGGLSDVNIIRRRAQLPPLVLNSAAALLSAIGQENRIEFFCEEGHRFFDLRRTGTLDAVETADEAMKGSNWQTYKQYWPIPSVELLSDPHLTQTPGY